MDKRFTKEKGLEVFNGNELIIKGALEAGVGLITGYPGSPVADVFDVAGAIRELLLEHGIAAQMANNEALSAARLNGSQMADIRAMAVMKSVGLHVASDALALGNLSKFGHKGAALVVVGDDPWTDSTQVPADSRFLSRHLHIPVMEPATFQELKDWVGFGFELSRASNLYILYLVTTNQADGGGVVEVFKNRYPKINSLNRVDLQTGKIPVDETVLLPPRTGRRESDLEDRYRLLHRECRERINRILYPAQGVKDFGFISSGLAYCYLEQALSELGLSGRFPVLKLGITFPIDSEMLLDFACQVKNIIVVEERRPFIEEQTAWILKEAAQQGTFRGTVRIWGKTLPWKLPGIPAVRGLNPSILIRHLAPALVRLDDENVDRARIERELGLIAKVSSVSFDIPSRTPTFCPGCPHRDSSSVLLEIKRDFRNAGYMRKHHRREPVDLVFHGDTGCYTMLMFEPNRELMHNYSGMGLGGGTGAGIDPFIRNKQIVFMGDSTFFHSGVEAISDSIKHHQDITYIILDNKTTAMTGHQPTPQSGEDILGRPTFAQDIERVLLGMTRAGTIPVLRVNPAYRASYRALIEDTILRDGVKIIIADKECGITYQRRVRAEKTKILRARGFIAREEFVNITPEVCEYCLECTKSTGCPGLTVEETDYGPKIVTDLSTCVADTACANIKACPSFEKIVVTRTRKPRDRLRGLDLTHFDQPRLLKFDEPWRVYIAGVGGMGVGVLASVMVHAGAREGYHVVFCDKKGLAIRNGGVYSEICYYKSRTLTSPLIPNGKANLLWGLDILEAARSLDPQLHLRVGSGEYTSAFVNLFRTPTIRALMGIDHFSVSELEQILKAHTRSAGYFAWDFSSISEDYLGTKLYANLVMMGVAYQRGMLPFHRENIMAALQETVKEDLKKNVTAFNLGRRLAASPHLFAAAALNKTFHGLFEEKQSLLARDLFFGRRRAKGYRELVQGSLTQLGLDDGWLRQFALRVYELIRYEDLDYARAYADRVLSVFHKDRIEYGYQATQAVLLNLAKVMLIKDEVYVSHLLTSPEKMSRDRARYHVDERGGDRIVYRHLNRPQFRIFRWIIEFDIVTRNWQLRLMKHCKFLRRLLPQWHESEKDFRRWYEDLVDRFDYRDEPSYRLYVQALSAPEEVRGYRTVRYPKMEEARLRVSELLGVPAGLRPPYRKRRTKAEPAVKAKR